MSTSSLGPHERTDENSTTTQVSSINFNDYATLKSVAESMLDVTLLMSNTTQLVGVLEQGPEFKYYIPLIVLISVSLILQIVIFILLVFSAKTNVTEIDNQKSLNKCNKITIILVGAILLINVVITSLDTQKVNS
ncbi:ninjurin-2-like isoform X1 [Hemiscyllium ocellatum]|uniref:ninjurin-2-like isoform X1 n=1 Tax=Hemiscyllium ocellatum TaxID=170820 RepID=UPI002966037B|nr:ninjurin-2-like isoform X1 [Hemiscyllium ocellatum]